MKFFDLIVKEAEKLSGHGPVRFVAEVSQVGPFTFNPSFMESISWPILTRF